MIELVWITDPHLNFLRVAGGSKHFGRYVASDVERLEDPRVVITGDIAECWSLLHLLSEFVEGLNEKRKIPTYFVLGNHDAYDGSIKQAREVAQLVEAVAKGEGNIAMWLTHAGVVELAEDVCLVGHDGWYDGRYGTPESSTVDMADFHLIQDFAPGKDRDGNPKPLPRMSLLLKVRQLGEQFAREAEPVLREAVAEYRRVIFATHVPPFKQASWHEGAPSDNNWLPWFTNKAMGDMLIAVAEEFPDTLIEVLCGHTHSSGEVWMLPNLLVRTGAAKYGHPDVHKVIRDDLPT
jgi:hypothetical protein